MTGPILVVGGVYLTYHLLKNKNRKKQVEENPGDSDSSNESEQKITLEKFLEGRS